GAAAARSGGAAAARAGRATRTTAGRAGRVTRTRERAEGRHAGGAHRLALAVVVGRAPAVHSLGRSARGPALHRARRTAPVADVAAALGRRDAIVVVRAGGGVALSRRGARDEQDSEAQSGRE